jgi:hypothetical protein
MYAPLWVWVLIAVFNWVAAIANIILGRIIR